MASSGSGAMVSSLIPAPRGGGQRGNVTLRFRTDQPVPDVPRGTYFRTPPATTHHCCYGYSTPFLIGERKGWRVTKLEPDTIFGPVHETHRNWVFLSVRVPVRVGHDVFLLWVNVYNAQSNAHYAKRIGKRIVDRWRANGWQDRYLDENQD